MSERIRQRLIERHQLSTVNHEKDCIPQLPSIAANNDLPLDIEENQSLSHYLNHLELTIYPKLNPLSDEQPTTLDLLLNHKLLTKEEEQTVTRALPRLRTEITQRTESGEIIDENDLSALNLQKSRDILLRYNMRLSANVAQKYLLGNHTLEFEDLLQEGSFGLMTAIEKFDPEKGYRFSTYAMNWVRQCIGRAVENKGKNIRTPIHIASQLKKLARVQGEFEFKTGNSPSIEELADLTGINCSTIEKLKSFPTLQPVASLDKTVNPNDTEATELGEFLRDTEQDIEKEVEQAVLKEDVMHALNELPQGEKKVISMLYGIEEDSPITKKQTAKEMQVSTSSIAVAEKRGLYQLRKIFKVSDNGESLI